MRARGWRGGRAKDGQECLHLLATMIAAQHLLNTHPHDQYRAHLDTCNPAQIDSQSAASCLGLAVSCCSQSLSILTLGILAVSLVFRLFSSISPVPTTPDRMLTQY
jgi:hypothetical protein